MLQTIIIVDSRHVVAQSFKVEAGFSTFHRFLQSAIPKYVAICDSHSWISRPLALVVLTDKYETPTIINGRYLDTNIASKTLESAEYQLAGAACKLAAETWGSFLVVALKKIGEMLCNASLTNQPQMTAETKGRIVIYSTDVLLAGIDNGDTNTQKQFQVNAELFCAGIIAIRAKFPNMSVEIVCVSVNELPPTSKNVLEGRNSEIIRSLQVVLEKSLSGYVSFTVLGNSSINFEEELRRLVAAHAPVVTTKLEFPPVNGAKCSIQFELSAITMGAADSLRQEDWISLSMFSIASRADVDPLFLEGGGLIVKPAGRNTSSFKSYGSLSSTLANKDVLLILRLDCSGGYQQYWAMIPPAGDGQNSQIGPLPFLYSSEHSAGSGLTEYLRGQLKQTASHMVAVRLTDRDGVLIPPNSAYTDQRSISAFSAESVSEQQLEADRETLKETSLYLEEALFGTMGVATQYNPLACPSGTLNKKVSEVLSAIKAAGSRSPRLADGGWNSSKSGTSLDEASVHPKGLLPQPGYLQQQQRQQQPYEVLQRQQPMIQEKFQKHRYSTSPTVTTEDLKIRQYQQGQESKMKPLQVASAQRLNDSSSVQSSRVHDSGGSVVGGVGRETSAGTVKAATYVAIPVQSRSSSSVGHTIIKAVRVDYGDDLQNSSNRRVNSSGYNANNKSNSESISGSNQSGDSEVQIISKKHPFKRGNIEISHTANVNSESMKSASTEKNNFTVPDKRSKVGNSKLKQPAKVETKKMFQKRVQAWNITNDEGDQASDKEVKRGKDQSAFEYDDIDDSDTEDVFEL